MKRILFSLVALFMLGVCSLSAGIFKTAQEGSIIVGFSESGDAMMKDGSSAVFMSADPNSVSTVVRYNEDSKIKSISGNGAVEFVYTNGKAQLLSCTPGNTKYKSSARGIIGWADELLTTICEKYGKGINFTLEALDKWDEVTNIANAKSAGDLAKIAVEDKFDVLSTVKDLAEWVIKKSNGGMMLAKTAANLIANYTNWRDKWSDYCYKAMLNLDKNRRLQKKYFDRPSEDDQIKQAIQRRNQQLQQQRQEQEKKKEKQKQEEELRQQKAQTANTNYMKAGRCPSHNGYDTYFHISRKNMMQTLSAAEMATVEKECGKEVAALTKTWMESQPEVREKISSEGVQELSKLTYDEWFDFARAWFEVMAIGLSKTREEVMPHMLVLRCEIEQNAYMDDKALGDYILQNYANWNITKVFDKYKVSKHIKLFGKKKI